MAGTRRNERRLTDSVTRRQIAPAAVGPDQVDLRAIRKRHLWPGLIDHSMLAAAAVHPEHFDGDTITYIEQKASTGVPATVTLFVNNLEVPSGTPSPAQFSSLLGNPARFNLVPVDLPATALPLPFAGTWGVSIWRAWHLTSSFRGGGGMALKLDDEQVWPITPESTEAEPTAAYDLPEFAASVTIHASQAGQLLAVLPSQDSGDPQTCDLIVEVALREPAGITTMVSDGTAPGLDPNLPRYRVAVGGLHIWTPADDAWDQQTSGSTVGVSAWEHNEDAMFGVDDSTSSRMMWWTSGTGWQEFPATSTAIRRSAVAWDGQRLWVCGGKGSGTMTSYDVLRSIAPGDTEWDESHTNHPVDIESATAFWMDGLLHVLGGRNASNNVTYFTHRTYDPQTDTWDQLPDLPGDYSHADAMVVGDRAYMFGRSGATWIWTAADGIQELSNKPTGRIWHRGVYDPATNEIYLAGSHRTSGGGSPSDEFWRYEVATDSYTQGPDLPVSFTVAAQMLVVP